MENVISHLTNKVDEEFFSSFCSRISHFPDAKYKKTAESLLQKIKSNTVEAKLINGFSVDKSLQFNEASININNLVESLVDKPVGFIIAFCFEVKSQKPEYFEYTLLRAISNFFGV